MEENNKINMPTLAAAIAYTNSHGGGGGGGTSNYNDLSNKPQIGGTTLTGNKSASDLGLVAAVEGKGLSTNDYTDADKAIVGGVTAALAGKQNVLTEGNNIKIDNNTISVNRWAVPAGKVVYTVITSDENYGQNVHVQRHTLGGALIDDRTFLCEMYKTVTIDDLISIYNPYASFKITLLKNSDEHQAGYSYTVNPITTPTSNSFTFMMEQEENDNDLIIRSELDEKQDTLTFDDTPTDNSNNPVKSNGIYDALELKQDATDDSLETTDKTIVGAINEHEGDISSLKSGLTNVQNQISGLYSIKKTTTASSGDAVFTCTSSRYVGILMVYQITGYNAIYAIQFYNGTFIKQKLSGSDLTINEDTTTGSFTVPLGAWGTALFITPSGSIS